MNDNFLIQNKNKTNSLLVNTVKNQYFINNSKMFLDLIQLVSSYPSNWGSLLVTKKYETLNKWVFNSLPLLQSPFYTLATKIYWIFNNISSFPLCPVTHKQITRNISNLFCPKYKFYDNKVAQKDNLVNKKRGKSISRTISITGSGKNRKFSKLTKENAAKAISTKFYNRLLLSKKIVPLFSLEEYLACQNKKTFLFLWKCLLCNKIFRAKINKNWYQENGKTDGTRCYRCFPKQNKSSLDERHVAEWLKNKLPKQYIVYHNNLFNWKCINPKQLDIVVVDSKTNQIKIAIEYNGTWFHSIEYRQNENYNQQYEKTTLCEQKNIYLFHLYEDEWKNKNRKKEIKEMILQIIFNCIKVDQTKEILILDRDKFPKTFLPNNYTLIKETAPELIKRKNYNGNYFTVPNSGKLIYQKN